MNSKRLYYVLVAAIIILSLGLIGGAYEFNALMQAQSSALKDKQNEIAVLDGRQTALDKAKKDIDKYQELSNIAKSIVPQDKDQAQAIGEIVKIANKNGVSLGSFAFPSSTLGGIGQTTKTASLSQLQPVAGIGGVYSLQVIVQSSDTPIPYGNFINFLKDLEQNRRTALVTSINITPDPTNPSTIGFNITLQEYIKP